MGYLARNVDVRLDPGVLVPGARSVICVADRYHDGTPDTAASPGGGARGRIARYARGDDYHRVMKKRLHRLADELRRALPDEVFRVCIDTAPLLERELAQRAGLGAVGKHTLLIEPGVGSWLLLGEIVTTAVLAPTAPDTSDPCRDCTRCLDACPTGAIAPWSVDATRCLSYLTIEHRTAIDAGFHEAAADWIFGCDVCQEVCPHNQPTERTRALPVPDAYAPRRDAFDLPAVLGWSEQRRRDAFVRSALKRAKLAMMKRNALLAAGNALATTDRPALRQRVEAAAADPEEDEMVRATARAVLSRLTGRAGRS
jgi:epoxyqueuosine reductase